MARGIMPDYFKSEFVKVIDRKYFAKNLILLGQKHLITLLNKAFPIKRMRTGDLQIYHPSKKAVSEFQKKRMHPMPIITYQGTN